MQAARIEKTIVTPQFHQDGFVFHNIIPVGTQAF
jgi:hypothetical protein